MKSLFGLIRRAAHDSDGGRDGDAFGASREPFLEVFYRREKAHPSRLFLHQPVAGAVRAISYGEAGHEARRMAAALRALGHRPGDRVGIYSKNCAHWILADLAILMAGCVSVPYYPTVGAQALGELIALGDLKSLFVGKVDQWSDRAHVVPEHVSTIAFPHYPGAARVDHALQWDTLIAAHSPPAEVHHPRLDEAFTVIFTSGTTGTPKGVVLTYESPRQLAVHELTAPAYEIFQGSAERLFSYLPLNHVAERFATEIAGIFAGSSIYFAASIETFAADLRRAQPTLFFSVPRIWTKIRESLTARISPARLSALLRVPLLGPRLSALIRAQLGLGRARVVISGAAPLPRATLDFFGSVGVAIQEVYGMSEAGGGVCFNPRGRIRQGSVGLPIHGAEVRLDPESQEVLIRTPWMMREYFRDPTRTAEVIVDGFIRSGDSGAWDADGYLTITGRVTETFKTAKGKFIVPSALEAAFFSDPAVDQVMIVGRGLVQPLVLVCLAESAEAMARMEITASLSRTMAAVNRRAEPHERIACAVVLSERFSVESGTLTPTLKLRRHVIDGRYAAHYERWSNAGQSVLFASNLGAE